MAAHMNLNTICAEEIMEKEVCLCEENSLCRDIAKTMIEQGVSNLPVVDSAKNLVGIISEFDLLKILQHRGNLSNEIVRDHMTREVMFVEPKGSLKDIVDLIEDLRLIRIPVVRDRKVVGSITRLDIMRAVLGIRK